jgi:hypothetical protein
VRRATEPHGVRLPDPRARAAQLELEGRTRAELEDVLQRIERHFRSEQAVRRRAEESEREAAGELARERELRVRLEEEVRSAPYRAAARGTGWPPLAARQRR